MDPEQALQELREWYNEVVQDERISATRETEHARLIEVLDLFDNLDNWIISGGFLPKEWRR